MKLLKDLKLKFPLKEVAPYSFCIVVPGTEFDPDWEAELADKGYKCFNVDIDGKPVTLVRVVKTEKGSGEKTVYSPPIAPIASMASTEGETLNPRRWPEKEEKQLLERWNKVKGTAAERSAALAPEFPGRTAQAIMQKAKKMRRERGLSRKYSKHSEKALEKASVHAPVDTPVHTPVTLDKLASDIKGILDVLDVQGRVLDKLFCALLMQAVEVKQEKGDLSIPPGLWIHYANALLEEDKQFREKFRLKVEQLLEASA